RHAGTRGTPRRHRRSPRKCPISLGSSTCAASNPHAGSCRATLLWYIGTMVPMMTDDRMLRARFEDASLPVAELDHRAHLRLGWTYLAEETDFALAAWRFRRALRRYADAVGAGAKVHETITWAYLVLLREAMDGRDDPDAASLLAAHP